MAIEKGRGLAKGKKPRRIEGLTPIADILNPMLIQSAKRSGPTPVQRRLVDAATVSVEDPEQRSILYQHSILCQTYLPYRDPGDDKREWERLNGDVHLEVRAGKAMDPKQRRLVQLGLPYGPKCRLVLMCINQLALVAKSPHIDVEDSLTAFVRRILKIDPKGRNIKEVKEQLARLQASDITLGIISDCADGTEVGTRYIRVVEGFNVWFPKNEHQRVLWPSVIDLSPRYFETLMAHAVPLHEAHIAALSHSGLALDVYAWLAQRLHRIPPNKPAFVSWAALHGQFGQGYTGDQAVKKFRSVFKVALRQVLLLYKTARITEDQRRPPQLLLQGEKAVWREQPAKGLTLHNSPPPVSRRLVTVG